MTRGLHALLLSPPVPLVASVLAVSAFEALGQSSAQLGRNCVTDNSHARAWAFLTLAVACYAGVTYFLFVSYQYKGVGIVNAMWSGLSILLMMAIGFVFFNERATRREYLGVLFIFAGVLLINTAAMSSPARRTPPP